MYRLVEQVLYSFYNMVAAVIIGGGRGLRSEARRRNQPNKSKLLLHKPFTFTSKKQLCTSKQQDGVTL